MSVQHLQTWDGERWPGNDLASEMRCKGPAVQAADVPARPRRGPRAVVRWPYNPMRRGGLPEMEVHRGRCGANLKTPRAGRFGRSGLAEFRTSTSLDVARRRGPWVRHFKFAQTA
jgi:hypothetical protein